MALLIAASFMWAISFALIDRSGIDPDLLAAARLGVSALMFAPLLVRAAQAGRAARPRRVAALATVGAVQFGAMYVLVLRAYEFLAGHEVALFTVTTPLFVVLWSSLLERSAAGRAWLGALVAVGAAWVLGTGGESTSGTDASFWTGFALVQGANALFAAGLILYRRVDRRAVRPAEDFGWVYAGAFAVTAAWALTTVDRSELDLTRSQWWVVLYLGTVPSGIAFYLWNRGATRVSAGVLAVMNNLKIPLAVAVALAPPFLEPADLPRLAVSSALLVAALFVARPRAFLP